MKNSKTAAVKKKLHVKDESEHYEMKSKTGMKHPHEMYAIWQSPGYQKRVRHLEHKGATTSDAQGAADVEYGRKKKISFEKKAKGCSVCGAKNHSSSYHDLRPATPKYR